MTAMTVRLRRHVVPAFLAAVAVLTTGCTVGPSQRPPVAVRGEGLPPGPAPPSAYIPLPDQPRLAEPDPQQPAVEFTDCTADRLAGVAVPADRTLHVDCTELTVPSDPDQPELGRSRIGVLRVGLADAPPNRPPLLVLGDTSTVPSATHAVTVAAQVPRPVLEGFTLVGMDRRGFGQDGLDCAPADARAAIVDADAATADGAALDALLEQARAVVQDCHVLLAGGASGFRTASTAADIGKLRDALGVTHLSAVGTGDGATALIRWAATAPGAVGRLVLDGPDEPGLDEPGRSEARAKAAEAAFDTFGALCTTRPACPLAPDPRAAVNALLDQLRRGSLIAGDGRRLTPGATMTALLYGLAEPRTWPGLAAALAAARTGDPAPLLDLLDPVAGLGGRFDPILATTCNDVARRMSPGEIGELTTKWRTAYPLFGPTLAVRLLACTPWPTVATPAPPVPAGLPPMLVVGTARDPRAPLEGFRRAAEALPSARFLAWQGAGTGAYPRTVCVNDAVDQLLLDGVAPPGSPDNGVLCPP